MPARCPATPTSSAGADWLRGNIAALARQPRSLAQIAVAARGDDVLPRRAPAAAARHHVVERQVVRRAPVAAVLADERIAQEHVEPGERRPPRRRDVVLQRDHARQPHGHRRRAHLGLVFRQHRDPVEEHRLHRVLPGPQRQREIRQRPEIRVQHQRRIELATVRQTPLLSRPERKPGVAVRYRPARYCAPPKTSAFIAERGGAASRRREPDFTPPSYADIGEARLQGERPHRQSGVVDAVPSRGT